MAVDLQKYTKGRNFHQDLAWSLNGREEEFWDAVYRKAFDNLVHWELNTELEKQKQGIDRVLYLANGNVLYVDEKKRSEVYDDILLEHTSNVQRGTPGWIEKDLSIDYLSYAFMPTCTCYFFPWPFLRRAWNRFSRQWRDEYWDKVPGYTSLGNGITYTTHSVAVPIPVLMRAVNTATIIDVSSDLRKRKQEQCSKYAQLSLGI